MRLLFFDFGSGEILLIVLAAFLIFGPSKIPEIARNLGKFINDIKRASEDIKTEINKEADRIERDKKLKDYKSKIEEELESGTKQVSEPKVDTDKETEVKQEVEPNEDSTPYIQ
ncbi:MAG: twin-arginine translocase TatA/TatE family subunit [Bacteroidales bacterium]|nr:twin-arginine translocase TatA/TatE family subunit [Bacteroidales bacterium]